MRNPALKPRHWEHIQQIFGYHFTEEEPLTLGLLNKIDAFDHTEAIEEVSGQASSEASLEGILKKVLTNNPASDFVLYFYLKAELRRLHRVFDRARSGSQT